MILRRPRACPRGRRSRGGQDRRLSVKSFPFGLLVQDLFARQVARAAFSGGHRPRCSPYQAPSADLASFMPLLMGPARTLPCHLQPLVRAHPFDMAGLIAIQRCREFPDRIRQQASEAGQRWFCHQRRVRVCDTGSRGRCS
jgi:hypothetical protein